MGKKLSQREKKEIMEERNNMCEVCGNAIKKLLHIHHIIPVSLGGNNHHENLLLLCPTCHSRLHKLGLDTFIVEEKIIEYKDMKVKIFDNKTDYDKYIEFISELEEFVEFRKYKSMHFWEYLKEMLRGVVWENLDNEERSELLLELMYKDHTEVDTPPPHDFLWNKER